MEEILYLMINADIFPYLKIRARSVHRKHCSRIFGSKMFNSLCKTLFTPLKRLNVKDL